MGPGCEIIVTYDESISTVVAPARVATKRSARDRPVLAADQGPGRDRFPRGSRSKLRTRRSRGRTLARQHGGSGLRGNVGGEDCAELVLLGVDVDIVVAERRRLLELECRRKLAVSARQVERVLSYRRDE